MEPVVWPARTAIMESVMTDKWAMEPVSVMSDLLKLPTALTVLLVIMERTVKNVLSAITTGIVGMEKKVMEVAYVKKDLILSNSAMIASVVISEVIAGNVVQEI